MEAAITAAATGEATAVVIGVTAVAMAGTMVVGAAVAAIGVLAAYGFRTLWNLFRSVLAATLTNNH